MQVASRYEKRRQNVGLRRHRDVRRPSVGPLTTHRVMVVTKVAHRFLERGAVVRTDIPFAEGTGRKIRPAIVIGVYGRAVELIPCTSSPKACRTTDVPIADLSAAGLIKSTKARTGMVKRVDRGAVIEVLGRLSTRDQAKVFAVDNEVA